MNRFMNNITRGNIDSTPFNTLHLTYVRNSRAISVLWIVFTICFTIINIVVFLQPWLGDTSQTKKEGYFGLYESCKYVMINPALQNLDDRLAIYNFRLECKGTWASLSSALNPVPTFAIGFSALLNLVCIASFLVLFLFVSPSIVFSICGIMQLISTMFMLFGVVIYPNNWDSNTIVDICETSSSYFAGKCEVKWAYILAIIGVFDIFLLSILAFVLSKRQATNYRTSGIGRSGRGFGLGNFNLGFGDVADLAMNLGRNIL